jgi:hypothetical protein
MKIIFSVGSYGMPLLEFGLFQIKYSPSENVFGIFERKKGSTSNQTTFKTSYQTFQESLDYAKSLGYDEDVLEIYEYIRELQRAYSARMFEKIDLGDYNILKTEFNSEILKQIQKYGIHSKQALAISKIYKD